MSRPWGRPGAPSQQINPNIFSNQLGLGGQFAGVPAMSLATNLNALVNQAAFSNMNMLAAAQAQQARAQLLPQVAAAQQQTRRSNSPPPGRTQRTFVGVVTKLMETYGFVDEDVFFQTNVIRGNMPRVGDRVMVEASYNASMPFKWNAYRIQLLPNENVPQMQQHSAPSQQIQRPHNGPEARWSGSSQVDRIRDRSPRDRLPPRRASPPRRSPRRSRTPPRRSPRRASPYRKASPPRRVEAHVKRERERTPIREKRESSIRTRSPTGSIARRETASPPRRRQRIVPRYQCYIPKPVVISAPLKYAELHQRYTKLYIPSDFVTCEFSWLNSFPLDTPFTLSPSPITFHVVNKDVDVLLAEGETLPSELPADADSRYSVRVLMLAHPGVSVVRQKVYGLLPDGSIDESTETQPITRALQFLVGSKGKFEVMGIGGPWSPSLDGENPADPQTLINTAIRTTRAMTGLDLSSCPRWYKMVHLKYYRPERNRLDSVVLMMPDLNATPGLMPSPDEYKAIEERLQKQLAEKLATIDAEQYVPPEKPAVVDSAKKEESVPESAPDSAKPSDDATTKPQEPTPPTVDVVAKEEPAAVVPVSEEKSAENGEAESAKAKKSWSELQETIKTLKVAELREELEARGLDSKGVKNSLIQRLQEAIDKEKAADESTEKPVETEPAETESAEKMETEEAIEPEKLEEVIDAEELVEKKDDEKEEKEEEKPAISEKELEELKKATEKFEKLKKERKAALERHYSFPKEPARLIFPSKTAKNGKFECKVASIQSLLDYRLEDNKEASFEAFLFAESFREMLDRTNAFAVYYNLNCALDREAERKRRDEALTATEEAQVKADEAVKTDTTDKEKETKEVQPKQKEAPKEDPRSKFKGLVNNVNAFTAFAHFDQNIVGHLMDHDLEQLIHSIGLDISRGDIHRLIKKFSAHDQVSYRNFTDKWVDKDGNVKYEAVPRQDAPTMAELIAGHVDESVSTQKEAVPILGSTPDITDTGIVFYKGTVLNVNHVLEQQRKIEVERETALLKVEELDGQLKTTKEDHDRLEKKRKNLTADVDYYKKKLYDTEKCLKKSDDDTVKMKTTLQDCKKLGEKIMLIVDKVMPTKKKEEVNKETEKSKTSTVAADDSQTASTNGVENSAAGADENSANNQELLVADEANENGNVSHKEAMDTSDVKTEQADTKEPEETSTA